LPSGKQSKRQRRATVPPPPEPRRKASRRVLAAGAGALVLVAVAVVLVAVLSGGSSKPAVPARGSLAGALPGAVEVQRLLEGIPQHGNVLGSPTAPVTLVEYVDLQCPYCRDFETAAMPGLIARFVRSGKVKVVARPIAFVGPDSVSGRSAVLAAARQNKLFNLTQVLYANQGTENTGWLDDTMIRSAAASVPALDVPLLLADAGSAATGSQAGKLDAQAAADAVRSTPTILVGGRGEAPRPVSLASPTDAHTVAAAIESALRP
jgi:protein-disulfide isomerase